MVSRSVFSRPSPPVLSSPDLAVAVVVVDIDAVDDVVAVLCALVVVVVLILFLCAYLNVFCCSLLPRVVLVVGINV